MARLLGIPMEGPGPLARFSMVHFEAALDPGVKPWVIPDITNRLTSGDTHDQKRVGEAQQAISDGADYLVVGRALINSQDIDQALVQMGVA